LFVKSGSSEQQTTVQRREIRVSEFRKATFGLRLLAGLTAPNRDGISPVSIPGTDYESVAESNRELNQRNAEPFQRTAGNAANWFKV
jgi:hypothetical protein